MKGKEKCKALKEIRRQIASENDIPFAVSECTHKGDCKGTCPKCEAELKYLEKELALRQKLGKAVAVVGVSVGFSASLTACSPADTIRDILEHLEPIDGTVETLEGDMQILEGETTLPTFPDDPDIQGMIPDETDAPDEIAPN